MDFTSSNPHWAAAIKLHKLTHKSTRTCCFALQYHHGNFKKALDMLSDQKAEDGR